VDTPDCGHTFSNRTHFRACDRFWLSSVQRGRREADEKKEEERKKESVVKYKSADNSIGRPTNETRNYGEENTT